MKRIISSFIMLLICMLALAGCKNNAVNSKDSNSTEKLSVVATIFPPYDFVREIAGDNVELTMLLPPGSESHSYEPSPQDMITVQNCDVFIYVGGESDTWVDGILDSMDTGNMKIISLMDCVDVVEEEIVPGMEEEDEEPSGESEPDEVEYDEHVWTSPKNAKLIVQKISDVLCEVAATNANTYKTNTTAYLVQLDHLDAAFQEVMNNASRNTLIFADRFPFRYFVDTYGLNYYAAFPGCSTETEASAATVAFLIDKVNQESIPVVFFIEFSNEKMADTICESTNAKKLPLYSCHNVKKADFEGGVSYLELMTQNVENIKEVLQ